MDIVAVTDTTLPLYPELTQHFEREFFAITDNVPNERGLYASDHYVEERYLDPYWGSVVRQSFSTPDS